MTGTSFTADAADWTTAGTSGGANLSVFGWTYAAAATSGVID